LSSSSLVAAMTGISDVFKSAQNVLQHANLWLVCALNLLPERVAKQARLLFPNALGITQSITCPQPIIPDPQNQSCHYFHCISEGGQNFTDPLVAPSSYDKPWSGGGSFLDPIGEDS
jgi:hypothetical protein